MDLPRRRSIALPAGFLAMGVLAFALILLATPHGAGLSPDSVGYVQVARNIAAGKGIVHYNQRGRLTPLTWFPPLYPLILSSGGPLSIDPLVAARYVSAACLAVCVAICMGMAWHCTGSPSLTLLAGLLAMLSPPLLSVHRWAWSEPPFLVMLLAGLSLLALHLRDGRMWPLIASAILLGLASVTRYAGMLLPVLGMVLVASLPQRSARKRIRDALLFGLVGFAPMAAWIIRGRILHVRTSARQVQFHPVPVERLEQLLQTFSSWICRTNDLFGALVAIAIVGMVGALIWIGVRHRGWLMRGIREARGGYLLATLVAFNLAYLPAMIVSISFIDASTPLGNRILSPMYVPALVFDLWAAHRLWQGTAGSRWRWAVAGAGIYLAGYYAVNAVYLIHQSRAEGLQYASSQWRESPTLAWIRRLPPNAPIYTNAVDPVYLLAGRVAQGLPTQKHLKSPKLDRSRVRRDLHKRHGFVVYFNAITRRQRYPSPEELARRLKLERLKDGPADGVVVYARSGSG